MPSRLLRFGSIHISPSPSLAALFLLSAIVAPSCAGAQKPRIKPLFEVFGTFSAPPLAAPVRDAYAFGGGVRVGGGAGLAVGALAGRYEIAGFYEGASSAVRRPDLSGASRSFGRNAIGLRVESRLVELGRNFGLMASSSLFHQTLERVAITVPAPSPGGGADRVVDVGQRAWGGRVEVGIEHRGFLDTNWFVSSGATMAGAGTGRWTNVSGPSSARNSIGVTPIITLGVRSRTW